MSTSIPLQLAETIQTAHINREPSPAHDLNPSTAASKKEPVHLEPVFPVHDDGGIDGLDDDDNVVVEGEEGEEEEGEEDELDDETEDEELYRSRVTPRPRRHHLPPMPDLRFEQSYLWSIRNADTWWKVGWITVRDQVSWLAFLSCCVWWLGDGGWEMEVGMGVRVRVRGGNAGSELGGGVGVDCVGSGLTRRDR